MRTVHGVQRGKARVQDNEQPQAGDDKGPQGAAAPPPSPPPALVQPLRHVIVASPGIPRAWRCTPLGAGVRGRGQRRGRRRGRGEHAAPPPLRACAYQSPLPPANHSVGTSCCEGGHRPVRHPGESSSSRAQGRQALSGSPGSVASLCRSARSPRSRLSVSLGQLFFSGLTKSRVVGASSESESPGGGTARRAHPTLAFWVRFPSGGGPRAKRTWVLRHHANLLAHNLPLPRAAH